MSRGRETVLFYHELCALGAAIEMHFVAFVA